MDEPYITFNREQFKNVVHFVVSRCNPEQLGNVKLHKILYFSDMLHFVDQGTPLTGVDYLKQQFGPTARHLPSVLDELSREGRLRVENRKYFGFDKKDFVSLVEPDTSGLGNRTQSLLNDVIEFVCGRSAKEISELSHDLAWQMAEMGERIPYAAAFGLQPVEVTSEAIEACVTEARRIRPILEAESRESHVL